MDTVNSFNQLTPPEAERLALLAEECAEVIHAVGKILRHGYASVNPTEPYPNPDNRGTLTKELGDLSAAVWLLVANRDVEHHAVKHHERAKLKNVKQYLHYIHNGL